MKIICIGRNYIDHAKELNNPVPKEPLFFLKPDTALIQGRNPFVYPSFSQDIHHEVEVVIRICRLGKHIEEKFAHRYYDRVTVGIDFTARDIQKKCKEKGWPWEKAKAFDGSAPVGDFRDLSNLPPINNLDFQLTVNNKVVQQGNTSDMIFNVDRLISYVSQYVTLKIGDLIFTGTPEGVGPVERGDVLEASLNGENLLRLKVK